MYDFSASWMSTVSSGPYTFINGAYLTYEEHFKGSLEVGKVADLVVLDLPDIEALQQNPEVCFQMRDKVLLTMVEGTVRYQKAGYAF